VARSEVDDLGRSEITYPLGKVGMGEVWHPHGERPDRDVVIKVQPEEPAR
jgi:hypothetical protein